MHTQLLKLCMYKYQIIIHIYQLFGVGEDGIQVCDPAPKQLLSAVDYNLNKARSDDKVCTCFSRFLVKIGVSM